MKPKKSNTSRPVLRFAAKGRPFWVSERQRVYVLATSQNYRSTRPTSGPVSATK